MTIETVDGRGEVIATRTNEDQRYRIVRTPTGYLLTVRSRDAVGAMIVAEWLHRTEEAAIACMVAVDAGNAAFRALMRGVPAEALLRHFGELTDAHKAICERLSDQPLIGEEVRALRQEAT